MEKSKSGQPKSSKQKKADMPPASFPVVGIGASAGGLEALTDFFKNLPDGNGMAFVIIQHLDPSYKGIMPELIQRLTTMQVSQADDSMKVRPNNVYIIPPNKYMSILRGVLYLFDLPLGIRLPIDFFFHSLADDLNEKSIGIILSGMGSDGTSWMRSIKERAGITLVQEPSSAKFDSMPRSVIDMVSVDIIAAPAELPEKLIAFLKQIFTIKEDSELETTKLSSLEKIIILIRLQTGNDFSQYKKSTIYRRIERRMGIHKISRIASYIRFLQDNPGELVVLFNELLIGATNFFRDPSVWENLQDNILPSLLANKPYGYTFRIWVPGCSTGEEAFTLAILVKESIYKLKLHKSITCQIFATDLSYDALTRARAGYFHYNIAANLSQTRLIQNFTKIGDSYKINPEIREMIIFASHNVLRDPPFTKLDILSCRNLLIYLEHELQSKLLSIFNYSLNPGGVLILGTSETLGSNQTQLTPISSRLRLFQKVDMERPVSINFKDFLKESKLTPPESQMPVKTFENIQSLTDNIILQQYAPASVLVNDKGDILYLTRRAGQYLEPAAGKANMNIFAMLRQGFNPEFTVGFRKAIRNFENVILKNINIDTNESSFVDVIIQQLDKPEAVKGLLLVVFKDVQFPVRIKGPVSKKSKTPSEFLLEEMELEQTRLREELHNTLEAMQASDEELKSTNEELQSTNEELQSTNEELTTSKEELQSINEELQTVNFELMTKVDDFTSMSNDMKNLLESTDIATLFLDKDLLVRRFTSAVTKIFKLIPTDLGRSITDFSNDLIYPEFYDDMHEVLRKLNFIEKPVSLNTGSWFSVRIMPYRTTDDRIDGLVITFNDITTAKKLEVELNETIAILRSHNLK
jgi:two-component system CheB/CheR fusion protein